MPAPSETTGAELQAKIGKDFPRMRVLLVDRHSGARHTLRSILSTLGFTAIHNAATSTEVMRQIKGNDFDLILSDYHLDDGRDGQQLLEELRALTLETITVDDFDAHELRAASYYDQPRPGAREAA